jgi:hypothetical protein
MMRLIRFLKRIFRQSQPYFIWSTINLNYNQGNNVSIWLGKAIAAAFAVLFFKWCESLPRLAKTSQQYAFTLPFILSSLNLNVSEDDTTLTQLSFGVFILSLVALLCLINIVGYMIGYYLVTNSKYEDKYPKLSRFIAYYKKSTLFFLGLEILISITCLIILLVFSLLYVYAGINNR